MANQDTHVPQIETAQSQKEATANALFDAASPSMLFGRNEVTTAGLTWGYLGGVASVGGSLEQIANGTVTLTNNATNYLMWDDTSSPTGVTKSTSGWTPGLTRLYAVTTSGGAVIDYIDWRTNDPAASSVTSVNGQTGAVVLNADQIELPDPESVFGSPQSVGAGMRELEARITAGMGSTTLAGLTDVDLNESPSPSHGDVLAYDGPSGKWMAFDETRKVVPIQWASTITLDLEKKPDNAIFRCTLGGNTTVNIRGARDGQKALIELKQDGTGSRTVTLSSDFRFGTDIASFTATTTLNKLDRIGVIYRADAAKYDVIAVAKGF